MKTNSIPMGPILKRYCDANRASSKCGPDLIAIAERHNMRWLSSSPFLSDDPGSFHLRAPGDEETDSQRFVCYAAPIRPAGKRGELTDKVKKLAALPFFYRLNSIRQLSTTNVAANLEGSHNRLAHCLGTTDVAAAFLESVESKGAEVNDVEAAAIVLLAFLHDSFHGPFGHTLDMLRDVLWVYMEERADKYLLQVALCDALDGTPSGPIWESVTEFITGNSEQARNILNCVLAYLDYEPAKKNFAIDILDGPVDADRLDYVWRDAQHLMRGQLWTEGQTAKLVAGARVVRHNGTPRLFFDLADRKTIEDFLAIRKDFYTMFYENPTKIVLDEMLTHAICYALSDEGILDSPEEREQFVRHFCLMVDEDLLHVLWEMCSKPEQVISHFLLQDVAANRPFEIIWKHGIPVVELEPIALRYGHLKNIFDGQVEPLLKAIRQHPGLKLRTSPEYLKIIREFTGKLEDTHKIENGAQTVTVPPRPGEKLFWLQNLYGNSFKKKFMLEQILWDQLLESKDESGRHLFSDALAALVDQMQQAYYPPSYVDSLPPDQKEAAVTAAHNLTESLKRALPDTPLVFISLSWIPSCSKEDLLAHSRGFGENDIRFHKGGVPVDPSEKPTLRFSDRDEDYVALVSAPKQLVDLPGVGDVIRNCFERLLSKNTWVSDKYFLENYPWKPRWSSLRPSE
jgi:HD superfamily phosphohydrolase